MDREYQDLLRLVTKLLIVAAMMYGVYRQKKKNKAMLGQAAQELNGSFDDKIGGKGRFVFSGAGGATCSVWLTQQRNSQPGRLYLQVDRSPQFRFSIKTKRSFWQRSFLDIIPRGQVVSLGMEFDSLAKLRAGDPIQTQFHFNDSRRREALTYLLAAGFNTITADGTKMIAVKDNFTPVDLDSQNLNSFANAVISLG